MTADAARKSRPNWLEWPGLESYARRLALVSLLVWLLLFGLAFGAVFHWMNEGGWISRQATLVLGAWSGFFAGLVGSYSATLQVRKALLLGVVQPTAAECQRLGQRPGPAACRLWRPALGWAMMVAAAQTLLMLLLSSLGEGLGYSAGPYLFYTALVPAVSLAFVCHGVAVREGEDFIRRVRSGQRQRVGLRGHLLLRGVLPYALVSAAVGLVTAGARFFPQLTAGTPLAPVEMAEHFALSVLLVGLLLPPLARFKARVERLSPLELAAGGRLRRLPPYRWWSAPALAAALWAVFRWGGLPPLPAQCAVAIKGLLCLLTAFFLCLLAARGALGEDPHPYFEISRRLHQRRREFLQELDRLAGLMG